LDRHKNCNNVPPVEYVSSARYFYIIIGIEHVAMHIRHRTVDACAKRSL